MENENTAENTLKKNRTSIFRSHGNVCHSGADFLVRCPAWIQVSACAECGNFTNFGGSDIFLYSKSRIFAIRLTALLCKEALFAQSLYYCLKIFRGLMALSGEPPVPHEIGPEKGGAATKNGRDRAMLVN